MPVVLGGFAATSQAWKLGFSDQCPAWERQGIQLVNRTQQVRYEQSNHSWLSSSETINVYACLPDWYALFHKYDIPLGRKWVNTKWYAFQPLSRLHAIADNVAADLLLPTTDPDFLTDLGTDVKPCGDPLLNGKLS